MITKCGGKTGFLFLILSLCLISPMRGWSKGNHDWARLASIHRIAVIPFFYGGHDLDKLAAEAKGKTKRKLDLLLEVEQTIHDFLPKQLRADSNFKVTPEASVDRELAALKLINRNVFFWDGKPKRKGWPVPDIDVIRTLCRRLHVDALLVGAMKDPITTGSKVNIVPAYPIPLGFGFEYDPAHVISPHVWAYLITSDGHQAWRDQTAAYHPRINDKASTQRSLLLDWREASELMCQNLIDSITQLPPIKPTKKAK